MKKVILIFGVIVAGIALNFSTSYAQEYRTGIGVRAGASTGVTVKHFLNNRAALDGILTSRWQGFNITGLYEVQNPISDVDNFYWYYGGGAHIGFWDGNNNPWFDDDDNGTHAVMGIDGVLGLEYTLEDAPIVFSLDWKPAFNLIGYSGFWGDEFALSVRFAIK